jgi:hypothetical protein
MAQMPSPIFLLELAVLGLFFGWPFLAERRGWFE